MTNFQAAPSIGTRQYKTNKPVKWAFKNFVRADSSDIMHDFFLYIGKRNNNKVTGPYAALKCTTVERIQQINGWC